MIVCLLALVQAPKTVSISSVPARPGQSALVERRSLQSATITLEAQSTIPDSTGFEFWEVNANADASRVLIFGRSSPGSRSKDPVYDPRLDQSRGEFYERTWLIDGKSLALLHLDYLDNHFWTTPEWVSNSQYRIRNCDRPHKSLIATITASGGRSFDYVPYVGDAKPSQYGEEVANMLSRQGYGPPPTRESIGMFTPGEVSEEPGILLVSHQGDWGVVNAWKPESGSQLFLFSRSGANWLPTLLGHVDPFPWLQASGDYLTATTGTKLGGTCLLFNLRTHARLASFPASRVDVSVR